MIIKLGGMPTANPMELEKNANAPYLNPPKNTADINRIIRIVMEAEPGQLMSIIKSPKRL